MKYIFIIIIIIAIIGGGFYFYENNKQEGFIINTNAQQNMTNDTPNTSLDNQEMITLVKDIYQAFKDKDINKFMDLSKVRNENLAKEVNQPLDTFSKSVERIVLLDMNKDGKDQDLLPIDFSTITFLPQTEQNTFKVQVIHNERKSTQNPIVYVKRDQSKFSYPSIRTPFVS